MNVVLSSCDHGVGERGYTVRESGITDSFVGIISSVIFGNVSWRRQSETGRMILYEYL